MLEHGVHGTTDGRAAPPSPAASAEGTVASTSTRPSTGGRGSPLSSRASRASSSSSSSRWPASAVGATDHGRAAAVDRGPVAGTPGGPLRRGPRRRAVAGGDVEQGRFGVEHGRPPRRGARVAEPMEQRGVALVGPHARVVEAHEQLLAGSSGGDVQQPHRFGLLEPLRARPRRRPIPPSANRAPPPSTEKEISGPSSCHITLVPPGGAPVASPASTTTGNSRPLDPCTVRMRTASSSGSGTTVSTAAAPPSTWSRAQARNCASDDPPASTKARAWSSDEPEPPPVVARAALGEGELDQPALARRCRRRARRRAPTTARRASARSRASAAATGWSSATVVGPASGRVPTPAGAPPLEQLGVGAGEGRRAQGGDDGDLVGRVLDGREQGEHLAHDVGAPHQRAALDAVRDVGVVEGPLDAARAAPGSARGWRRRRSGAHGDRRRRRRSPAPDVRSAADRARDLARLPEPHLGGVEPVLRRAAEDHAPRARRRGWRGRARSGGVRRLDVAVALADERARTRR